MSKADKYYIENQGEKCYLYYNSNYDLSSIRCIEKNADEIDETQHPTDPTRDESSPEYDRNDFTYKLYAHTLDSQNTFNRCMYARDYKKIVCNESISDETFVIEGTSPSSNEYTIHDTNTTRQCGIDNDDRYYMSCKPGICDTALAENCKFRIYEV